jgi:hypothetical protein
VATGARVRRKEGPKSARRRVRRRTGVERGTGSSMSRSRPSREWCWRRVRRGRSMLRTVGVV